LIGADGKPFKFDPPVGDELPSQGFTAGALVLSSHYQLMETDKSGGSRQHFLPSFTHT